VATYFPMQVFSQQILGVDRSSNACLDCESSTSSKSFSAYEPFKKKRRLGQARRTAF